MKTIVNSPRRRAGFTLVELLVVVSIMLILTVMTLVTVNVVVDGDRVRATGRQIQSYLAGARDRAIFSREPRGVRFLLDPQDNRTVTSMVYIKPTPAYIQGRIRVEWVSIPVPPVPPTVASLIVAEDFDPGLALTDPKNLAADTGWSNLVQRGLLTGGARIKIPNTSSGNWYRIDSVVQYDSNGLGPIQGSATIPKLKVTVAVNSLTSTTAAAGTTALTAGGNSFDGSYLLELPPQQLPGAQPVSFSRGVVLDLDRSNRAIPATQSTSTLPTSWTYTPSTDPLGFAYSSQMDVMFTPKGVITGPAATAGIIHLYLADQRDSLLDLPWNSNKSKGDKLTVTIFTQTGAVSSHRIKIETDATGNITNVDPFAYAETGEVAGK